MASSSSPASSGKNPLQEAIVEFSKRLYQHCHLELPHCSQFSNEAMIKKLAEKEKGKVWSELLEKLGELAKTGEINVDEQISIVNQFAPRIQSVIDECVQKHEEYKEKAESLMNGRIDQLCDFFRTSIEEKLLEDSEMDIDVLRKHLQHGKLVAMNHFGIWKHGNLSFFYEMEEVFKHKLEEMEKELLNGRGNAEIPVPENGINEESVSATTSVRNHENEAMENVLEVNENGSSNSSGLHQMEEQFEEGGSLNQGPAYLDGDVQMSLLSGEENQIKVNESATASTLTNVTVETGTEIVDENILDESSTSRKRQTDTTGGSGLKMFKSDEDETGAQNLHPLIFSVTPRQIYVVTTRTRPGFKTTQSPFIGINEAKEVVSSEEASQCQDNWSLQQILEGSQDNQTISFKIDGEEVTQKLKLEFLLGLILKRMKYNAETELKENFCAAIITIPIWLSSLHRVQIKDAAEIAGFSVVTLINQESLVAYGYAMKGLKHNDDISGLVVLSENFHVISGVLYKHKWNRESESWELTMTGDDYYFSGGNEDSSERRKGAAEFWLSLQAHGDLADMDLKKAMFLFSTESSEWMEVFKDVANEAGYKNEDGSHWIPPNLKVEEMREAIKEYQPSRLNIRHENVYLPNYMKFDSGRWLPREIKYELPMEVFDKMEKIPQFCQENLLSKEMISVGELDFKDSYLTHYASAIVLTFKTDVEGVVSMDSIQRKLRGLGPDGKIQYERLWFGGSYWTSQNLNEEEKEVMKHLVGKILPVKSQSNQE